MVECLPLEPGALLHWCSGLSSPFNQPRFFSIQALTVPLGKVYIWKFSSYSNFSNADNNFWHLANPIKIRHFCHRKIYTKYGINLYHLLNLTIISRKNSILIYSFSQCLTIFLLSFKHASVLNKERFYLRK